MSESDEGRKWNIEDGMTESIMSTFEDKQHLIHVKEGKLADTKAEENQGLLSVVRMVQNIDELSERAVNMKLTKNDFIDCLRRVTKSKVLAIKEAKEIFERRVGKLAKAQDYMLQSQQHQAARAAEEVFRAKGDEVRDLFGQEARVLQGEYSSLHRLIRNYQL